MSFIEVENISKKYKISKRKSGIPGMVANLFVPKFEDKEAVKDLNLWEGDRIFFRLLNEGAPFFSLKLVYEGDRLAEWSLNGSPGHEMSE